MTFTVNKPFETDSPTVDVDPGLPPGVYHFQLVVTNHGGERSRPARVAVRIVERVPPDRIPVDPGRGVITPPIVPPRPVTPPMPIVTPIPIPRPPTPRRPDNG